MLMVGVSVAVEADSLAGGAGSPDGSACVALLEDLGMVLLEDGTMLLLEDSPIAGLMQAEDGDLLLLENSYGFVLQDATPGAQLYFVDESGNYLIDEDRIILTA